MRGIRTFAVYAILALLLWWTLRNVALGEIWDTLRQLHLWQIALLLALNVLVFALMTARWWIIVRAENRRVPFVPLIGYRLSAFGVSYFTLGPQVGGEPLQVINLQKYHGLSYARATSAVIMDKLLEFLVNFLLLAVGAWAVFQVGLIPENGGKQLWGLIGLGLLLTWPLVHILLMYNRVLPITVILRAQPFLSQKTKTLRLIFAAERMAASFCQRHFPALLAAVEFRCWRWDRYRIRVDGEVFRCAPGFGTGLRSPDSHATGFFDTAARRTRGSGSQPGVRFGSLRAASFASHQPDTADARP
jgi:hypothetical protein